MKLKHQLLAGFGMVLSMVLIIGVLSLWSMGGLTDGIVAMNTAATRMQLASDTQQKIMLNQQRELIAMLSSDLNAEKTLMAQRDATLKVVNANLEQLQVLVSSPEDKTLLSNIVEARRASLAARKALMEKTRGLDSESILTLFMADLGPVTATLNRAMDEFAVQQVRLLDDINKQELSTARHVQNLILMALIAAVALALGVAFWIIRSVFATLGGEPAEAATQVALIAGGDLTRSIKASRPDSLLGKLESMRVALGQTIERLADNAQQLARFSEELATSAQQVASGASEGSDAASTMAASVEQMTVSFAHVSDNASVAAEKTTQSSAFAKEGSDRVMDLARSMATISTRVKAGAGEVADLGRQSNEIRSIVGVIKEIAEQTNLLALNAAIEAARAGDTGRGFAVVADEVRKLAERTQQSTQDIARKIEAIQVNVNAVVTTMNLSVEEVRCGEKLASLGAEAIKGIQTATGEVSHLVNNISEAIRENSSASHEVAKSVEQMAQLTEENSGAATQVASTADELTHLALELNQVASQFKTHTPAQEEENTRRRLDKASRPVAGNPLVIGTVAAA